MANPHVIRIPEDCPLCKKEFPAGTPKYGHTFEKGGKQKWYCPKCAENLGLVCRKCKNKKNPLWMFCWNCHEERDKELVSFDSEYEKEVAKLMQQEKEKEIEKEITAKTTCTSIDCPERSGGECNAHERMEKEIKRVELEESINAVWNEFRDKLFSIIRSL